MKTLDKLIKELTTIRERVGRGDIPVYVEVNGQQEKMGNYEFDVNHHYHEKSVYEGIEQDEINEVILMPFADGFDY